MINNLFAYDTISTSRLMKASFDLTKDTFWKKRENKNFVQQSFLSLHLKGEWKLVVMLLIIKRLSPINACQNISVRTSSWRHVQQPFEDRIGFPSNLNECSRPLSLSLSLSLSFCFSIESFDAWRDSTLSNKLLHAIVFDNISRKEEI